MGDIELQAFADRIKELRLERNITQKEFAEKIGVTAAALSAYENNIKNPSIAVAKRIAETFHVSIDWLCGLTDKENYSDNLLTYGDMLRLILRIVDNNLMVDNWKILNSYMYEELPFGEEPKGVPACAVIETSNIIFRNFFKDWEQIQTLYTNNTIDKHLYTLWLDDKLKEFDKIKLEHSIDS